MEQKRKRGGQPGNHNALKHGYYSGIFRKEQKKDYCSAGDVRGLDEEIALLRYVIRKAAAHDDEKHLDLMVKSANTSISSSVPDSGSRATPKGLGNSFAMYGGT